MYVVGFSGTSEILQMHCEPNITIELDRHIRGGWFPENDGTLNQFGI